MKSKTKNRHPEAFHKKNVETNAVRISEHQDSVGACYSHKLFKAPQNDVKWFVVLLVLFGSLFSCDESREIKPSTLGYDFYPVEIGQYRVYDVEEIRYLVTGFDTTAYQLRETIFDSIVTFDQTTYLIRRDVRDNSTEEWESDSIWTVAPTELYVAISENSIPFIKLTFPVRAGADWDGNSLNALNSQVYYYQNLEASIADSLDLNDQIRVVIEDIPENTTGVNLKSEVYVRNIGLVEKDYLNQTRCTASNCGADLGEVIGGRALKQTLIDYGIAN